MTVTSFVTDYGTNTLGNTLNVYVFGQRRTKTDVFSEMGSDCTHRDPNPIVHEDNPTSTAGISAIVELCNAIGRRVELEPSHAEYSSGWARTPPTLRA